MKAWTLLFLFCGSAISIHAQANPSNAVFIAGTVNYVSVPHTASFNSLPITVMAWVNTSATTGIQGLVNKYVDGSVNGWTLFLRDGRVRAWYFVSGTRNVWGGGDGLDGGFIADGQWHHIAFVVDAAGGRIFVDGVQKFFQVWTGASGAATTTQEMRIGSYPGANGFVGSIFLDDVSVWNVALNTGQVQNNRNGGTTGVEANRLALYRCDEDSGTTVADSAPLGGSNNGTWVGPALFEPVRPSVTVLPVSGVDFTQATFNGIVNANRSTITAGFQYGITTNYGSVGVGTPTGGASATTNQAYSVIVTGLTSAATYHFRVFASNSSSAVFGSDQTFQTIGLSVTTLPASALTENSAQLHGVANPRGASATGWFEWGTTTNYDNATPPQPLGSGGSATNFSQSLAGLAFGTTFHFRAVGSNSFGLVVGTNQSFRTLGLSVETLAASEVTQTSATLNGVAKPDGPSATGWFEFGFSTNYGNVTPPQALGGGTGETNFSATLTGLIPGVSYHFRAVASNAFGVAFGANQTFPRFGQQAYLKASNGSQNHNFGKAVAMSGDTLVVGSPSLNTAYVFVPAGDSWIQQALLTASNRAQFDGFGDSVAISGDTIVVGAPFEDSNATGVNGDQNNETGTNSGAAYVFVRNGTNWTQQAYLKAADAAGVCGSENCIGCSCISGDFFGFSVAISGDTVVVGAVLDDSSATGVNGNATDNSATNSGAAYVFVRSGTNWTQQAYFKASNTEKFDNFGNAVAVSGDLVVVGADSEDSNAIGINGNQSNNNAFTSGAAYVFARTGTAWTQQAYLKASNTGQSDGFGTAVAASGNTILIGAPGEDSNATGVNGNQTNNSASASGAVYAFARSGTTWTQTAYLKASNTDTNDSFGVAVALSESTAVIGARFEDSNATGVNGDGANNLVSFSGAAYVFARSGTEASPIWSFRDYLKASNTDTNDFFGVSVAVSGNLIVVGADGEDSNARGINGDQSNNSAPSSGAAYVFGPPLPPTPEINVFLGSTNILDGGSIPQIIAAVGHSATRGLIIKNTGTDFLTGLGITIDGPDAAAFSIITSPVAPVTPTSNTTFIVRFAPTSTGTNIATLHIASNDEDENPFDLQLSGLSLSFTQDRDGDGLNDASEFLMASLGFNFQANQSSLVSTLFNSANGAGLFRSNQLQALNVNSPLVARDPATGLFKLTIGVEKATLLTNFFLFPMTAPQTTINAEGKLEFQFSSPDGAAFFRLESK